MDVVVYTVDCTCTLYVYVITTDKFQYSNANMTCMPVLCLGSNCLAGCLFVISDYQNCMDHGILDTWIEVGTDYYYFN